MSLCVLCGSNFLSGCARSKAPGVADVPLLPASMKASPAFVDCNPRWSHDGTRIAFLRATPDRRLQLFLADADLTRAQSLLQPELVNPDRPYAPDLRRYVSPDTLAWSPDDDFIAYERSEWFDFGGSERLPGTGLWTVELESRKSRPLAIHTRRYTGNLYYFRYPQWATDGGRVAFVGEGLNGQQAIFVRNFALHSSQVHPRYDKFADSDWPAWNPQESPDDTFALAYRQGIRRAPFLPATETLRRMRPGAADGSDSTELWRMASTKATKEAGENSAPQVSRAGHLVWSPDGHRLAFSLTPDANAITRSQIWVYGRDGKARRVSPANGSGYFAPVWIDSQQIGALQTRPDGLFNIISLELSTGLLTTHGVIESADCDWSPDRRFIVYAVPPDRLPAAPNRPTTLRRIATGILLSPLPKKKF